MKEVISAFNPTMVRLLLISERELPLYIQHFQSHNGAIAALAFGAGLFGLPFTFNPTMVRLLLGSTN